MAGLRIAAITDIHYGLDVKDKLGSKAPRLMDAFAKAVNNYSPDIVVDIGDRVSAVSEESDRGFMQDLQKYFNKIAAPIRSLLGNHDVRFLTRDDNEQITGSPAASDGMDIGGYHLVFWNPEYHRGENGFDLADDDINWLKDHLAANPEKPTILFSHVPLDSQEGEELAPITKYYFWSQNEQVREILEQAGNVKLCVHGHRHRERFREINGVHYLTQQSFTYMWREKYRVASRTFSFIEGDDDKLTITIKGKTPKSYEIPLKPAP